MTHRIFTQEFKLEAALLVVEQGYTITEASDSMLFQSTQRNHQHSGTNEHNRCDLGGRVVDIWKRPETRLIGLGYWVVRNSKRRTKSKQGGC